MSSGVIDPLEWAAADLAAALELALPLLRDRRDELLEIGCASVDGRLDPDTIEPDLKPDLDAVSAAIAAAEAALGKAGRLTQDAKA